MTKRKELNYKYYLTYVSDRIGFFMLKFIEKQPIAKKIHEWSAYI